MSDILVGILCRCQFLILVSLFVFLVRGKHASFWQRQHVSWDEACKADDGRAWHGRSHPTLVPSPWSVREIFLVLVSSAGRTIVGHECIKRIWYFAYFDLVPGFLEGAARHIGPTEFSTIGIQCCTCIIVVVHVKLASHRHSG